MFSENAACRFAHAQETDTVLKFKLPFTMLVSYKVKYKYMMVNTQGVWVSNDIMIELLTVEAEPSESPQDRGAIYRRVDRSTTLRRRRSVG